MSAQSQARRTTYDVTLVGGGHNGLVAAAYLAQAGLSVLVLEANATLGGATQSKQVFAGQDARLSVYSYLISLFPEKIVRDLGLKLQLAPRRIASYTPSPHGELLIRNESEAQTQRSFFAFCGNDHDYRKYQAMQTLQTRIAEIVWPSLLEPLQSPAAFTRQLATEAERAAWRGIVEEPLGHWIEHHIDHDLIRGLLFTDAKIGVSTHPHDASLLQNRTFLLHIIGRGTGLWHPPVGGMGALVSQLEACARHHGAEILTRARVTAVDAGTPKHSVTFACDDVTHTVETDYVLHNNAPGIEPTPENEGSVFKINFLVKRLPKVRSTQVSPSEAFTGTFHIQEGYEKMTADFHATRAGRLPEHPACEIYCHSLSDPSILSPELQAAGYHTLTCFGLDAPYPLFEANNEQGRSRFLEQTLASIDSCLAEPIADCLATDAEGRPCIESKSPVDLERELGLPRGNIFHSAPSWPFATCDEHLGQWGVETEHARIYRCGSSALRGGAVSGIPGHNAAQKVLEDRRQHGDGHHPPPAR